MRELLMVAGGGALGALGRYGVTQWTRGRGDFPWGTLTVNVVGSFLLGVLMGLALSGHLGRGMRAALATGFCGAFTTFSTFSYETLALVRDGRLGRAGANVGASLVLGGLGVVGGLALAQWVSGGDLGGGRGDGTAVADGAPSQGVTPRPRPPSR
ncbi:MAG: fluoride efflux transporter CrcB [Myxococcota bacterium]